MATYTTNLNLEKPATSENFDLLKINANWDKIDAAYNSKIGYIDVDMSGLAVTTADAGWYYGEKSIVSSLPSNSRPIGIAEGASFDANVFYQITTADTIRVKSSTSRTLGSGRSVRVFYYKF